MLLRAQPGESVSVEVLEDVALIRPDATVDAVQTKSVGKSNPISDRSVELWKTLANWVDSAARAELDPLKTRYLLFLSKKRDGTIAQLFHAATDLSQAHKALAEAKSQLRGPKSKPLAATLKPHVDRVFTAKPETVAQIIAHFSLAFGRADPIAAVSAAIRDTYVAEDLVEPATHYIIGWTKTVCDRLIESGHPAVVAHDAFRRELTTFLRKYDQGRILYSFAPEPDTKAVEAELPIRVYIRQLAIIDVPYDDQVRAANDYLKAHNNRSIWAEKGLVNPGSFDEFEEVLERNWRAKRDIVTIQNSGKAESDLGKLLLGECSCQSVQLENLPVPSYFVPGCLHALADCLRVGWHPRFLETLGSPATESGGER